MSDQPENEVKDEAEELPREVSLMEECVAIPDLDALESAVIELAGCDCVLAWQSKGGQVFALTYSERAGFKWRDIETLKKSQLKAVN